MKGGELLGKGTYGMVFNIRDLLNEETITIKNGLFENINENIYSISKFFDFDPTDDQIIWKLCGYSNINNEELKIIMENTEIVDFLKLEEEDIVFKFFPIIKNHYGKQSIKGGIDRDCIKYINKEIENMKIVYKFKIPHTVLIIDGGNLVSNIIFTDNTDNTDKILGNIILYKKYDGTPNKNIKFNDSTQFKDILRNYEKSMKEFLYNLHSNNYYHKDFKLDNTLYKLNKDTNTYEFVVSDYGSIGNIESYINYSSTYTFYLYYLLLNNDANILDNDKNVNYNHYIQTKTYLTNSNILSANNLKTIENNCMNVFNNIKKNINENMIKLILIYNDYYGLLISILEFIKSYIGNNDITNDYFNGIKEKIVSLLNTIELKSTENISTSYSPLHVYSQVTEYSIFDYNIDKNHFSKSTGGSNKIKFIKDGKTYERTVRKNNRGTKYVIVNKQKIYVSKLKTV